MTKSPFEDYLREVHMAQYHGTDDDSVDDFDKWLTEIQVDDLITYADEFIKSNQTL